MYSDETNTAFAYRKRIVRLSIEKVGLLYILKHQSEIEPMLSVSYQTAYSAFNVNE